MQNLERAIGKAQSLQEQAKDMLNRARDLARQAAGTDDVTEKSRLEAQAEILAKEAQQLSLNAREMLQQKR